MSGLMQKDICLLMQRKSALFILVIVGIMMGFSTDGSFVIGYITMLTAIITISTISYDEFDNGYSFLLTLPITRKLYVQSKYVFCFLAGLLGWGFSILVFVVANLVKGTAFSTEDIYMATVFIPFYCLILALMLPLQMKFGAEGSRFVIAALAGVIAVIAFVGNKVMPEGPKIPDFLVNASNAVVVAGLIAVTLIATGISFSCSLRVMNNKTF